MRTIKVILWLQIVLGAVVAFMAFGHMHSAAMGMENGSRMRRELEQLQQSPAYREPPQILGSTFARLIENRFTDARQKGRLALLTFVTGLGASLFAVVMLWFAGWAKHPRSAVGATSL